MSTQLPYKCYFKLVNTDRVMYFNLEHDMIMADFIDYISFQLERHFQLPGRPYLTLIDVEHGENGPEMHYDTHITFGDKYKNMLDTLQMVSIYVRAGDDSDSDALSNL